MRIVINEPPDSLTAWIGLAGVAVGVLLTGLLDLWRGRIARRDERRRAIDKAVDGMRVGVAQLIMAAIQASAIGNVQLGSAELIRISELAVRPLERIQEACAVLQRTAPALETAAKRLQQAAIEFSADREDKGLMTSLRAALTEFDKASLPG